MITNETKFHFQEAEFGFLTFEDVYCSTFRIYSTLVRSKIPISCLIISSLN